MTKTPVQTENKWTPKTHVSKLDNKNEFFMCEKRGKESLKVNEKLQVEMTRIR
jgi:hypothetical protein